MTYSWTAVSMRDGTIIAPLPNLACQTVGMRICAASSASASFPVGGQGRDAPPVDWDRATTEGATVYVLLDDAQDGTQPVPVWGGWVTSAPRDLGDVIPVSLSTMESYLDCRYVGNLDYAAGTDQNTIVSNIIATEVNDGTINIRVQVVGGPGVARERHYLATDSKTVLSVLTELAGVIGGPEWTIGWEWQHNPERITPVLYVGTRLGTAVTPGLMPAATFEAPGSVISARLSKDYAAGKGANNVTATSSASTTTQPTSLPQVYTDPLRPTFEYRFTPSTSISDTATLTAHAQAALAQMQNGARSLSLVAAVESAPRLGRDWSLGDDVGYVIGGTDNAGNDTVPAFPGGWSGTARAMGWDLTLDGVQTVTPIIVGSF